MIRLKNWKNTAKTQTSTIPSVAGETPGSTVVCSSAAASGVQPSRIRNSATNGVAKARYGIRLPHFVRVRSLVVERIGFITKFIAAGMLPTTSPISAPDAWNESSVSGSSVGTST